MARRAFDCGLNLLDKVKFKDKEGYIAGKCFVPDKGYLYDLRLKPEEIVKYVTQKDFELV